MNIILLFQPIFEISDDKSIINVIISAIQYYFDPLSKNDYQLLIKVNIKVICIW